MDMIMKMVMKMTLKFQQKLFIQLMLQKVIQAKFVKLDWLVPADQITTRYTLEDTNEQLWTVPLNAGTYGLAFHADRNNYYEHIDGVFTFTIAKRKFILHLMTELGILFPNHMI